MLHPPIIIRIALLLFVLGCDKSDEPVSGDKPVSNHPHVIREDKLPKDILKRRPETDRYPPILLSDLYEKPIPLPYPINTSGAEDSPFILPDGKTLYFFFTPDVRIPANKQLFDEVTGVWVCHQEGTSWTTPVRVWLQDHGKLALDGAVCIQGDEMWFASAREGYTGVNMFTAHCIQGQWINQQYAGDRLMKEVQIGEVHIHQNDLYFHSPRQGGLGDYDIWMTSRKGNTWSDPVLLRSVNSPAMDGYPFISSDGNELWFTRTHRGTPAIFRSAKIKGQWGEPELIVSQFAGEPTLDNAGNLYFVHHFYENNVMIEADLYVAYNKSNSLQ